MSFDTEGLKQIISKFTEIEKIIEEEKASNNENNTQQRKIEIVEAYNKIISYARPVWGSKSTDIKEYTKSKLIDIYYRLKNILQILNVQLELPVNLTTEIALSDKNTNKSPTQTKETQTDKEQGENSTEKETQTNAEKSTQADNNQPSTSNTNGEEQLEEILQSTVKYDSDTFQALLDEFDLWDRKITRKNASKDEDKIEERTQKIIGAYNNLVEFATPIINKNTQRSTKKIRDEITARKDAITDDLQILESDIQVPDKITEKIKTSDKTNTNSNSKNSESNSTDDKKLPSPNTNEYTNTNDDNKSPSTNTNTPNNSNKTNNKMATNANDYYNMCTRQLNYTYEGDALGLPPFIDSIELLQSMDPQKTNENILRGVIRSKLKGKAREYIKNNATVEEIKTTLQNKIKVTGSKIITGRLMALRADKTNFGDYANKAEDLAEQLKRALIFEDIPNEKANQMTIDTTIELCAANTHSTQTKSVLDATQFDDPRDVIAKFIIQERKQTGTQQVMAFRTNNRFNNRGSQNTGRFQRNNYHNNNNRNNYRGRNFNGYGNSGNFRNNYRGRQNSVNNSNWRQNNNNGNRRYQSRNVYYTQENAGAPPPGAAQTAQQVQIQQAGDRN